MSSWRGWFNGIFYKYNWIKISSKLAPKSKGDSVPCWRAGRWADFSPSSSRSQPGKRRFSVSLKHGLLENYAFSYMLIVLKPLGNFRHGYKMRLSSLQKSQPGTLSAFDEERKHWWMQEQDIQDPAGYSLKKCSTRIVASSANILESHHLWDFASEVMKNFLCINSNYR